jgi:ribosome-associated protein
MTATKTANAAHAEAIEKLRRRPIFLISIVAGTVVAAIETTNIDKGSVANALFVARLEPIIPPSVTITIEPVVEISWHTTRILRFRTCIGHVDEDDGGRILTYSRRTRRQGDATGKGAAMDVLKISDRLSIPMSEIDLAAVRSQGAGGQNVNKVATAIHLRFDIRHSAALSENQKTRLLSANDKRINSEGVLVIKSQQFRSQDRNRQAALQRLIGLLREAMHEPKKRIPTRPGKKAKQRRLDDKSRRSAIKKTRSRLGDD